MHFFGNAVSSSYCMEIGISAFIAIFFSLGAGAVLGYLARQTLAKNQLSTAEGQAAKILSEAEDKAKKELVSAKTKALEMIEQAEAKTKEREEKIFKLEQRVEKREESIEQKMEEVERGRKTLQEKADQVRALHEEAKRYRDDQLKRLEVVAGMTQEEARDRIVHETEEKHREFIAQKAARMEKDGAEELESRASGIMAQVIQRYSRSHAGDIMTSTVPISSEDMKGKIIGKEGRNIRVLEKVTGVEILIDDTPEAVVLSSFDPVRRERAKIVLETLLADGRINPARIEEVYEQSEKELNSRIREAGEAAVYELGIAGLDPKLVHILGTLRYRTSFKQNVLLHSMEVGFIAGALAAELGYDVMTAKKAGLLHDIGKAIDHKVEGTHVNIGIKILEKFGMAKEVINGMRSHHDEYPYASPIAYLVTAADAISASRPGARRDTVENYIKRLEDLEALVNGFDGVDKSFAIQAGREVRVFVAPEKVDDAKMAILARSIADKIQEDLKYPGEIRVNVMRETRAIEIAR